MQQSFGPRAVPAPAVLGVVLIAFGTITLIARELGLDVFTAIGSWGWPFFVILPGVALLAASLLPAPPRGIGFAVAGSIVTTVGTLLLYQSRADHFESWAYAWALIPLAAGLAMAVYGSFARERKLGNAGVAMAAIAAGLFLVGAWFFEGLFAGQRRFADVAGLWPIGIILLGGVITVLAIAQRAPAPIVGTDHRPPARPADQAHSG